MMLVEHEVEMTSRTLGMREARSQPGIALGSVSVYVVDGSGERVE